MSEERFERSMSKVFRPHSSLPQDDDYDFEAYVAVIVDNFRGPIRQFQSRMLDIGNLMCVNEQQRSVFRDMVFQTGREMVGLIEDWCSFYGISSESVKDAIYDEHQGRPS